jgi:hypothetical protein
MQLKNKIAHSRRAMQLMLLLTFTSASAADIEMFQAKPLDGSSPPRKEQLQPAPRAVPKPVPAPQPVQPPQIVPAPRPVPAPAPVLQPAPRSNSADIEIFKAPSLDGSDYARKATPPAQAPAQPVPPPPVSPSIPQLNVAQVERNVRESYQSAFGRQPDAAELRYWVDTIRANPGINHPDALFRAHLDYLRIEPSMRFETVKRALHQAFAAEEAANPALRAYLDSNDSDAVKNAIVDMMAGREGGGYKGILAYLLRPEVKDWYIQNKRIGQFLAGAQPPNNTGGGQPPNNGNPGRQPPQQKPDCSAVLGSWVTRAGNPLSGGVSFYLNFYQGGSFESYTITAPSSNASVPGLRVGQSPKTSGRWSCEGPNLIAMSPPVTNSATATVVNGELLVGGMRYWR